MDILKRIEELRKIKNISVYELAKRCGIARNTIYRWYSKNYQPTFSTLELICEKGFGITIQEFLGINEQSKLKIVIPSTSLVKTSILHITAMAIKTAFTEGNFFISKTILLLSRK